MAVIKNNIVILGAMRNVNIQVAKCLSTDLDMLFFCVDKAVESHYGMSTGCLIDDFGIETYYDMVRDYIANAKNENAIIVTAGEVLTRKVNFAKLKENADIVLLYADDVATRVRIKKDESYPIKNDVLNNLLAIREIIKVDASAVADIIIDTTAKPAQQVAEEIIAKVEYLGNE